MLILIRINKPIGVDKAMNKILYLLMFFIIVLSMSWIFHPHTEIQSHDSNVSLPTTKIDNNSKCPGGFPACDLVKVARVIDGDTLLTDTSVRVRFVGVDTPETVKPNTPVQCYGPEASSFTKKMLTGREVWLTYKPDERLDKYGRTLAYIWLDKGNGTFELFDLMLIEQGYGRAYTVFPFDPKLESKFVAAESQAKEAKRGLWGACAT